MAENARVIAEKVRNKTIVLVGAVVPYTFLKKYAKNSLFQ